VPDKSFDFLDYTIGRCYSPKTGRAFIGTRPSKKKVARVCREISEMTCGSYGSTEVAEQVAAINRTLIGWSNYFRLGPVSKAYWVRVYHAKAGLLSGCGLQRVAAQVQSRAEVA
jgi:hypothetical protein